MALPLGRLPDHANPKRGPLPKCFVFCRQGYVQPCDNNCLDLFRSLGLPDKHSTHIHPHQLLADDPLDDVLAKPLAHG